MEKTLGRSVLMWFDSQLRHNQSWTTK